MQDDPHRDRLYEEPESELDQHRNRLWLSNGVAIITLLIIVFNPISLERWAASNPPSWGIETVRLTARVWNDRMGLIELDNPRDRVRAHWDALKRLDWTDIQAPAPASTPEQEGQD